MAEDESSRWRIERADRVAVLIYAQGYFAAVRQALLQARQRIMLVGWDFGARPWGVTVTSFSVCVLGCPSSAR